MAKRETDLNVLQCPFCKLLIGEPHEIDTGLGSTFLGGKCSCGAVYGYDRGGHSLGEMYVDALVYACNGDWDRAWSLIPDKDYYVHELSFDSRRNRLSAATRRIQPTFLFIRVENTETE
jgi:hypothetical protein